MPMDDSGTLASHDVADAAGHASKDAYENERAELLRTAQAARIQAVEANRAKSEFLATMSHELRTPLNAVLGYAQLLDMGVLGPVTPLQHEHLERLRTSSVHLLALVNDVLDLSRADAGRLQMVIDVASVDDAVQAALTLVRPQATARNIVLVNQCAGVTDRLYLGDRDRVRQILANLLSNSVKFTDPGGSVSVTCGTSADGPYDAGLAGSEARVFISVRDTGVGIEPQFLERMFEPFVQAQSGHTRETGGTGLGLAISRKLAHMMRGEITVTSQRGAGSNFTLWLPASESDVGRTSEADGRDAGAIAESGHVLKSPSGSGTPGGDRTASSGSATSAAEMPPSLRYDSSAAGPALTLATATEIEALGRALAAIVDELSSDYVRALRGESIIPAGHDVTDVHLRDHVATLFVEIATALTVVGGLRERGSALLRDGSELQRTISEMHGVQRYRLGWSDRDMERDAEVMSRVLLRALDSITPAEQRGAGFGYAKELLRTLMARAAANSIRAHRATAASDAR